MAGERRLPGLGLYGFWTAGTRGWKTGADENWLRLSALVQGAVISRSAAVPESPADGAVYIVPSGTNAGKIAVRDNGAWTYLDARAGLRLFVADTGTFAYHDGADWKDEEAGDVFTFLGLQDTPDAYGAPGQILAINPAGDAIEFVDKPTGGGSGEGPGFPSFTNNEGKVLAVNATGDGVEWVDFPAGGDEPVTTGFLRYRLTFPSTNDRSSSTFVSIAEIEPRGSDGAHLRGKIKAVSASSFYADDPSEPRNPARAVDGNNQTAWTSNASPNGGAPEWFEIEFVEAVEVASFYLVQRVSRTDQFPQEGTITVRDLDSDELQAAGAWQNASTQGSYTVPVSLPPKDAATHVEEAPKDGTPYVRQDGGWVSAPRSGEESNAHRYWRAVFTKPNPAGGRNDYTSVAEFEWRQSVGGPQTASGAGAFASGNYSGQPASNAYDGNANTFWESQVGGSQTAGTVWLGHDFGTPVGIAEVMIRKSTQYPDENPFGIAIQHSDDKATWTTAHTFETGFRATDSGTAMTEAMPDFTPAPAYVEDAPIDGKPYMRQDGAWVAGIASLSVGRVVVLSQADYDALTAKDASTLYLVPEA